MIDPDITSENTFTFLFYQDYERHFDYKRYVITQFALIIHHGLNIMLIVAMSVSFIQVWQNVGRFDISSIWFTVVKTWVVHISRTTPGAQFKSQHG